MPTTPSGFHGTRTVGITSFEMLFSPPSLGLAAQDVGYRIRHPALHPGPEPRWRP
jgi:hypothetical protein